MWRSATLSPATETGMWPRIRSGIQNGCFADDPFIGVVDRTLREDIIAEQHLSSPASLMKPYRSVNWRCLGHPDRFCPLVFIRDVQPADHQPERIPEDFNK